MATASNPYFVVQWSLTGKPCFLVVRTAKNRPKLLLVVREIVRPRRSCRSGRSPEACSGPERPIDRASLSVGGAHNGLSENLRRCSRRILSGQSDMTGCRPARVGSERTPWRSIGCIDPRGSPAGGAGSALPRTRGRLLPEEQAAGPAGRWGFSAPGDVTDGCGPCGVGPRMLKEWGV